jgi:hypothetical protein
VGIFPKKKVKKKDGVLGDGGRPAGSAADVRSVGEQVRGCAQDVQRLHVGAYTGGMLSEY